jgi:hypothetical protein
VKRHETDAVSLAFGVILLAIGVSFVSGRVDASDFVSLWALPAALLATGIVLAAVALTRHRQDRES